GTVLPIAPATISNYIASGDFILTTSNGGINFYIGNNEDADGTFVVEQSMRENLYEGSKRYAERRLGRELTAAEVSSYWFERGLRYAREHPFEELRLLGRKLLLFWNAYEIPNHYDINFFRTFSNVLRLNPFVFAWMVPVGIMGIYVSRRRWRDLMLLYLFLGTYMISLLPFFVTARYRLPAVPVVLIFAAHGIWWIWKRLRARERGGWSKPLIVLVASLIVVNLPIVDFTLGPSYAILGAIYRDAGRHELAVEQFRRATEESPGFDLAYSNMGAVLGRLGEYREAEEALKEALRLNPVLVMAHTNLGIIYTETGRFEDAREHLLRATELEPTHKEAWVGISRLGMATGDGALIERSLLKVLEIDPRDGPAHWNLAVLYSKDPATSERSAAHARAAASLSPEFRGRAQELLRFLETRDRGAGDR
ncbi:MAG: tetratricopeptide repeat protein, partial [Candidatus Eisenbacteria bacterium]|nr:tetratricopeptide repeat protein [Candidatus Eisenbacteria bacterium]